MAKSLNRIRFRCETCQSGLEARRSQIGQIIRCPYCHQPQKVPAESTPEELPEGYAVLPPDTSLDAEGHPYVSIACGLCGTRLHGERGDIGQPLTCPDCGAVTVLKAPELPDPETPGPPPSVGEYEVCAEVGQPHCDDAIVYHRYIPVVCRVCKTRLLAAEDEAGGQLVCPDCGTENRVPQAADELVVAASQSPGEYDVAGPTGTAPTRRYDDLFAIRCPRCQSRLHARRREAGSVTTCPDCSTRFTVPEPPESIQADRDEAAEVYGVRGAAVSAAPPVPSPPPKADLQAGRTSVQQSGQPGQPGQPGQQAGRVRAEDAWELTVASAMGDGPTAPPVQRSAHRAAAATPPIPSVRAANGSPPPVPDAGAEPDVISSNDAETMRARVRALRQKRRRERLDAAPRLPFLQGVWTFFVAQGVWPFWLFSGGGLFLILQLFFEGITLITGENPMTRFVGVLIAAFAGVVTVMGLVAVAGYWLAILRDTSEGCETIEDWPELVLIDWSLGFLHLLIAAACGIGIGTVFTHVLTPLGIPPALVLAASVHLLFPLILLSTLETNLPFQPVSLPILRSLGNCFSAWIGFYVAAALLWPVLFATGELCVWRPGAWTIGPASFILAAVAIVYFRLLGRLAMVCENYARREDLEAEEREDAEQFGDLRK